MNKTKRYSTLFSIFLILSNFDISTISCESLSPEALFTYLMLDAGIRNDTSLIKTDKLLSNSSYLTDASLPSKFLTKLSDLTSLYIDESDAYVFGKNVLYHLNLVDQQGLSVLEVKETVNLDKLKDCLTVTDKDGDCQCSKDNSFPTVFGTNDSVIVCGPSFLGKCLAFDRKNVRNYRKFYDSSKSSAQVISSYKSSVLFLGKFLKQDVFYVGFERDCERPHTDLIPFISARTVATSGLQYANAHSYLARKRQPEVGSRSEFMHGFEDDNYAYFVIVYKSAEDQVETRIGRICKNNEDFDSYTEVPVCCGIFFTAHKATHFKDSTSGATLLLSFDTEHTNMSAVCLYKNQDIEEMFQNATKNCFEVGSESELIQEFYSSDQNCQLAEVEGNLCKRSKNQFILGRKHLNGQFLLYLFNEKVSSIGSISDQSSTDKNRFSMLMTTSKSKILRLDVHGEELRITNNLLTSVSGQQFPSLPVYSNKTQSFYLISNSSIIQLPVNNCSIYTSCTNCVLDKPNCLWSSGKCHNRDPAKDEKASCPPEVHSYYPTSGPLDGGTHLNFYGWNFGKSLDGSNQDDSQNRMTITIGNRKCLVVQQNNTFARCRIDNNPLTEVQSSASIVKVESKYFADLSLGYYIDGETSAGSLFQFKNPKVYGIFPSFGPYAGGTDILVYGTGLDAGNELSMIFGKFPCEIISRQESYALCRTSPISLSQPEIGIESLAITATIDSPRNILHKNETHRMRYDGRPANLTNCAAELDNRIFCSNITQFFQNNTELTFEGSFQYLPNAIVNKVKNLNIVTSGDMIMRFYGEDFNTSAFPRLLLYFDDMKVKEASCATPTREDILECVFHSNLTEYADKEVNYQLHFDGQRVRPNVSLRIFPDPVFDNFSSLHILSDKSELIMLTGKNLNRELPFQIELLSMADRLTDMNTDKLIDKRDKTIKCEVNDSDTQQKILWCAAKDNRTMEQLLGQEFEVRISIGNNLSWRPGLVQFGVALQSHTTFWVLTIVILLVSAGSGGAYWQFRRYKNGHQILPSRNELVDLID